MWAGGPSTNQKPGRSFVQIAGGRRLTGVGHSCYLFRTVKPPFGFYFYAYDYGTAPATPLSALE
jgi:hypothetical protein